MLHTRSPACACKSAYQVENTHVQRLSYSLMLPSSLADQNWFGLPGATSTSCESDSHVSNSILHATQMACHSCRSDRSAAAPRLTNLDAPLVGGV